MLHKTFAGLRDAYRHTGNTHGARRRDEVRRVGRGRARAAHRRAGAEDAQHRARRHERSARRSLRRHRRHALARTSRIASSITRSPIALKRHQDNLSGKHGNCQIPKLIGSAARYGYTGDTADILAASFFWDRVAQHHSYATGGHGLAEYFGPPDQLSARVDGRTCESCNVYNMLKLTRRLFSFARTRSTPTSTSARCSITSSRRSIPRTAATSYMVPVGRGVQQEYQDMLQSFTCCVGTGMESHALHGDGVYYESPDTVWVNLFAPSTAQFTIGGARLTMDTSFPDGDTRDDHAHAAVAEGVHARDAPPGLGRRRIRDQGERRSRSSSRRSRACATGGAGGRGGAPGNEDARRSRARSSSSSARGRSATRSSSRCRSRCASSRRRTTSRSPRSCGDRSCSPAISVRAAKDARRSGAATPIPVLVAARSSRRRVGRARRGAPGDFTAQQVARIPGAAGAAGRRVARRRSIERIGATYSVYFDVLTPAEFDARAAAIAAERERVREARGGDGRLRAARRDAAGARLQLSERARRSRGAAHERPRQPRRHGLVLVRPARRSRRPTWRSSSRTSTSSACRRRPATSRSSSTARRSRTSRRMPTATGFYDVVYPVPANLVNGKSKVTVRFQGTGQGRIAPVFGVRTIRAKEM